MKLFSTTEHDKAMRALRSVGYRFERGCVFPPDSTTPLVIGDHSLMETLAALWDYVQRLQDVREIAETAAWYLPRATPDASRVYDKLIAALSRTRERASR